MYNSNINNNLNFKANYVRSAKIMQREMGKLVPKDAHILEMDLKNLADTKALEKIKSQWQGAEFAFMLPTSYYDDKIKVYVLSTQKANYEVPNPSDIKAFACIHEDKPKATLKFLQAAPEIINEANRSIKGVGKALMQGLTEHWHNLEYKTMDLFATEKVKPFYKNIFPKINDKESTMDSYTNLILDI